MNGYGRRSVFQAVVSISAFFCSPHPCLGTEPVTLPDAEQRVWTETRLVFSPSMQEQIDRTNEFLETQTPRLGDKLDQLKRMGYLDRRTKSAIESTIADARHSMSGMAVNRETGYLDATTARTIAYELGMAGDVLARQSEKIRGNLANADGDGEDPRAATGQQVTLGKQLEIGEILATMSRYLHETAKTIVRNLK